MTCLISKGQELYCLANSNYGPRAPSNKYWTPQGLSARVFITVTNAAQELVTSGRLAPGVNSKFKTSGKIFILNLEISRLWYLCVPSEDHREQF